MSRIIPLIKSKCPNCEEGNVYQKRKGFSLFTFAKMNLRCPQCNHMFQKEPGFFTGAMYVSYALVIAELILFYLLINSFFSEDMTLILMLTSVVVMSSTNYRYSRLIWMYFFTKKRKKKILN